jgi:hypothetical protein
MDTSRTELLARDEAGKENQSTRKLDLTRGKVHLIFLTGLVVLGALGSFALVSHRASSPDQDVADQVRANPAKPPSPANSNQRATEHKEHGSMGAGSEPVTLDNIEEEWGVRLTRLTLIADGGLVDLRYQVTEPNQASKVFDPEQPAYLLDEASGKAVTTAHFPKLGNLRPQTRELEGSREYYMEFSNPEGLFEPGDHVTLALGSHRLEHVPVQ